MLRFALSTLPVSIRCLTCSSLAAADACLASLTASAQSELVFVRQLVAQQSGWLQDLASSPDGGAYTIGRRPLSSVPPRMTPISNARIGKEDQR